MDDATIIKALRMCGESAHCTACPLYVAVQSAHTIDPVRHGRWVQDDTWKDLYFCSACIGRDIRNKPSFRFCPDCGARMDKEAPNDQAHPPDPGPSAEVPGGH